MNTNQVLLEFVILLAFIFILYTIYKSYTKTSGQEGFQQKEKFILKINQDIYDDFYSEIYDTIILPNQTNTYIIEKVLDTVQPDKSHAIILDIGSKTGSLVNYLNNKGYSAYGVEPSQYMVDYSISKYGDELIIKNASVESAMTYDSFLFSHIFCLNKMIYECENPDAVLKNCHYWLQNNGYFILHLIDFSKFNAIAPCGTNQLLPSIQQYGEKRVTKTFVDFSDFTYTSDFENLGGSRMIHKETFTDKITQNIRQNENTLRIMDFDSVVGKCSRAGFLAKGYFTLENDDFVKDPFQRIYIFEKI